MVLILVIVAAIAIIFFFFVVPKLPADFIQVPMLIRAGLSCAALLRRRQVFNLNKEHEKAKFGM
jgi:hypothetical protein